MMLKTLLTIAFVAGCLGMPTNNATEETAETTTAEFIDCTLYRPHPQDVHMYEVYTQGAWQNQTCLQALVWDQEMCRCENPPFEDIECPGHREVLGVPNQYEVLVWGVWQEEALECPRDQIWNQTGCRCDWDPEGPGAVVEAPGFEYPTLMRSCDVMFNATFDKDIKEHQSKYHIGRDPYGAVKVEEVEGAIGGGAVRIDDGKMIIWAMAGNDFSDAFQIQLRFKVDNTEDGYVTLFSNDCGYSDASIIVKYNSLRNQYQVIFRDNNGSRTLDCPAETTPPDFVNVSLELQEERLTLVVDGQAVCGPTAFAGQPPVTGCPLTLGGDPLGIDKNMIGYMDEVIIRRYCVVNA